MVKKSADQNNKINNLQTQLGISATLLPLLERTYTASPCIV